MTRNELPTIEEVEPLNPKDDACIADLVEVLRRHNSLTRFGITLLHKHFDTEEDECFVETCDPVTRTLRMDVELRSAVAAGPVKDTAWQLDTGRAVMNCRCINMDEHRHMPRG